MGVAALMGELCCVARRLQLRPPAPARPPYICADPNCPTHPHPLAPAPRSYGVSSYRRGNDFGYFKVRSRVAYAALEEQVGGRRQAPRAWLGGLGGAGRALPARRRRCVGTELQRRRWDAAHGGAALAGEASLIASTPLPPPQGLGQELAFNVREVRSPDGHAFR